MTLEEAIEFCQENADKYEDAAYTGGGWLTDDEIAESEEQSMKYKHLVELLHELKYYKDRQDLINKSWQELINYKEGIEKIKMRSQAYRKCGESILASGMEQALDILEEVKADDDT